MALQETEMAVPSASLRIRASIDARLTKGSIVGEVGRSLLQFRGYPLQLFWSHGRRALEEGGWGAFKYGATLFITASVMGAMSYQLARIATGQDAANMDPRENPDFIAQAIFKGGGLGIFGDLVQHVNAKDWRDFLAQNAGPVYSAVQDTGAVILARPKGVHGFWNQMAPQPHMVGGREISQLIKNNTPGSTLWYAKLAFQREVIDQMQAMMDPEYKKSAARMVQSARQHGTNYWWKPFETAPARSPELSTVKPPPPQPAR
jgi:hypothetical protein